MAASEGVEPFVARAAVHDNAADPVLEELRQAAARVRVRHTRIRALVDQLQSQRQVLDAERAHWTERAVALAGFDATGAAECLRQGRRADLRLSAVEAQLDDHLRLTDDLRRQLEELQQALNARQLRRNALAAPSVRARRVTGNRPAGCESANCA